MTGTPASARAGATTRQRQELVALLVLGAAGAALTLLALRQDWARATTVVQRPLPATVVVLTGQDLVPAVAALAVAVLASLAAVLATRRLLRRITGLIVTGLGAGIALLTAGRVSAADVLAAAQRGAGPAAGPGAGTAPGSVTAGGGIASGGSGGATGPLAGFPAHVLLAGAGWRGLAVGGALAVAAAGIMIALRANRLPVMPGRYDRPGRRAGEAGPARGAARVGTDAGSAGSARDAQTADAASMWESLSAGHDPTAGAGRPGD
jgi:Tryptophan-associated transmembrane protein (Trp_oprn_chp)